jgi:EKC/KEOPS complex subunit CGI121/TPRKB
MRALLTLSP